MCRLMYNPNTHDENEKFIKKMLVQELKRQFWDTFPVDG
jgi:hypothetical protein